MVKSNRPTRSARVGLPGSYTSSTRLSRYREANQIAAERRARSFAGHLLLPRPAVEDWLAQHCPAALDDGAALTEEVAARLAQYFGVSLDAALVQLAKLRILTGSGLPASSTGEIAK